MTSIHSNVSGSLQKFSPCSIRSQANSPAAKAGLRSARRIGNNGLVPGDIIQLIDSFQVDDTQSLLNALDHYKTGDQVSVHFQRDNKNLKTRVTLE